MGIVSLAGSALQYLKTYRDTLRETAKTQEDAINMGMIELQDRIQDLEQKIDHAGKMQKLGAFFGRNALHRHRKQKAILDSMTQLRDSDTMVSVDTLIQNLQQPSEDKSATIASLLARLDAGHEYNTQFITTTKTDGSGYGREQTAIKRHQLMEEMKKAALATPLHQID